MIRRDYLPLVSEVLWEGLEKTTRIVKVGNQYIGTTNALTKAFVYQYNANNGIMTGPLLLPKILLSPREQFCNKYSSFHIRFMIRAFHFSFFVPLASKIWKMQTNILHLILMKANVRCFHVIIKLARITHCRDDVISWLFDCDIAIEQCYYRCVLSIFM